MYSKRVRVAAAALAGMAVCAIGSAPPGRAQPALPPGGGPAGAEQSRLPRVVSGLFDWASAGVRPISAEDQRATDAGCEAHRRAESLYAVGRYREAEQECRSAWMLSGLGYLPDEPAARALGPLPDDLLGDILLAEGRPRDALQCYLLCYPGMSSIDLDLHAAIAACRVGELQLAARLLAKALTSRGVEGWQADPDRPKPGTLAGVEANALRETGMRKDMMRIDKQPALDDLLQAGRLAPDSALVAWDCGVVLSGVGRVREALVHFQRAAAYAHGELARRARVRVQTVRTYLGQHPEAR